MTTLIHSGVKTLGFLSTLPVVGHLYTQVTSWKPYPTNL